MTTVPTITVPEGAIPTPPGWCANCGGVDPDNRHHWVNIDGERTCYGSSTKPTDPAELLANAVWAAARDVLPGRPATDPVPPETARRALAMIGSLLRVAR